MREICKIPGKGFVTIWLQDETGRVFGIADCDIDADGSPNAYAPLNKGLDDLRNAQDRNGTYVGLLTSSDGVPMRQSAQDPVPGNYISTTTYEFRSAARFSQRRYVDSERVPGIVVPPQIVADVTGIVLGCAARVTNQRNGLTVDCVVFDIGPRSKCGEISIAAAKAIGVDPNPRTGGDGQAHYLYELWPGKPASVAGIDFVLQPTRMAAIA